MIHADDHAVGCIELAARVRFERSLNQTISKKGMHSIGGWHTPKFKLGAGWLGEAVGVRLAAAGLVGPGGRAGSTPVGYCWANVLPVGAEYAPHVHHGFERVAVWCLAGSGELQIESDEGPPLIVPDRAGQLVVFSGAQRHWVPQVSAERITAAVNLK